jgi:hypothetical protein
MLIIDNYQRALRLGLSDAQSSFLMIEIERALTAC